MVPVREASGKFVCSVGVRSCPNAGSYPLLAEPRVVVSGRSVRSVSVICRSVVVVTLPVQGSRPKRVGDLWGTGNCYTVGFCLLKRPVEVS